MGISVCGEHIKGGYGFIKKQGLIRYFTVRLKLLLFSCASSRLGTTKQAVGFTSSTRFTTTLCLSFKILSDFSGYFFHSSLLCCFNWWSNLDDSKYLAYALKCSFMQWFLSWIELNGSEINIRDRLPVIICAAGLFIWALRNVFEFYPAKAAGKVVVASLRLSLPPLPLSPN